MIRVGGIGHSEAEVPCVSAATLLWSVGVHLQKLHTGLAADLKKTPVAVSKLFLASVYANFTTTIVDDEGIEQQDFILADPIGNKLILGFYHVQSCS